MLRNGIGKTYLAAMEADESPMRVALVAEDDGVAGFVVASISRAERWKS